MSLARERLEEIWDALARPRTVAAMLAGYCALHFLARLALSPNFSLDEAEQVFFSQSLEWGYRFRHPPLITWMSWAVLETLGIELAGLAAMKYAVMAAGLVAYFAAGRIILGEVRLAALATFGLLATFVMGFLPHQDLMHTVLLATLLAAFMWAGAVVLERGRWRDHFVLGAVVGLGILSKYVFAIAVAGLAAGIALTPALRARAKPLRLAAALVLAAAIVAPYAWWAVLHEHSLLALARDITRAGGPAFDPLGWLAGGANLALALAGFAVPFVVLFAACYWRAFLPLPVTAGNVWERGWLRALEIAMALAALAMLAAVFVVGTQEFKPRWMHQVLLALPIYLFLRAKLSGMGERAMRIFALAVFAFAAAVFAARFAIYEWSAGSCGRCREYLPIERYASGAFRAGFVQGTLVAADYDLGGNLRRYFPDSRLLAPGYPPELFGGPRGGQCLAVWRGDADPPPALVAYLGDALGAAPDDTVSRGRIDAAIRKGGGRRMALSFMLFPAGKGACN